MKEASKLIGVLTVICLIAGSLMAAVFNATKGHIAEAKRQEKLEALKEVLPAYDNQPDQDILDLTNIVFYIARSQDAYAGVAFEVSTKEGYGDEIKILVGLNAEGIVKGIKVLEQKETPGLGAKITTKGFRSQFASHGADPTDWCGVTKDGGKINAITGATISSRAVSKAIRTGLNLYVGSAESIKAGKQE